MIKHVIVLGSSYNSGTRIGLDFFNDDKKYYEFLNELNKLSAEEKKNYSIATHTITTDSNIWSSVQKADPFFANVKLVKDANDFLNYLKKDDMVQALDVANYIISYVKDCTHLKLEKLTYYCYADYLCNCSEKLFDDIVYAFKYGPIIGSIYNIFKGTNDNLKVKDIHKDYINAIRSRILNSHNGMKKMDSINKTLETYKDFSPQGLVSLTHSCNSPWDNNGRGEEPYKIISDKDIIKYHKYETV